MMMREKLDREEDASRIEKAGKRLAAGIFTRPRRQCLDKEMTEEIIKRLRV